MRSCASGLPNVTQGDELPYPVLGRGQVFVVGDDCDGVYWSSGYRWMNVGRSRDTGHSDGWRERNAKVDAGFQLRRAEHHRNGCINTPRGWMKSMRIDPDAVADQPERHRRALVRSETERIHDDAR